MDEPQSPPGIVTLSNGDLAVQVAELGAELVRLQDGEGRDYLWNGDPAFWKGRAPLLFPMVGRANGDHIRVAGVTYPLPQHGFARASRFECIEKTPSRCVMRLRSSDATRAAYPFDFRLDVAYEFEGPRLRATASVSNESAGDMPCSLGFHPAFRWPLPGAQAGAPHEIIFDQPENAPIRRLESGLLSPEQFPTPVVNCRLVLDHALFDRDALIFDWIASRSVTYRADGAPSIAVSFPDMPFFGLWTKPDAPFICIEPWQGLASPIGYDGEFAERPGVVSIKPGATRNFEMTLRIANASRDAILVD